MTKLALCIDNLPAAAISDVALTLLNFGFNPPTPIGPELVFAIDAKSEYVEWVEANVQQRFKVTLREWSPLPKSTCFYHN